MAWDFETEPEFQKELDWIEQFVREEVEPLEHVLGSQYDVHNPRNQKLVRPLQAEVRKRAAANPACATFAPARAANSCS